MRCFTLIAFLVVLLAGNSSSVLASNWRLVKNSEGIKVYTRAVRGSGYEAFRGVTNLRASFKSLLAIMADTRNNCKWMHKCGKPVILKQVSFTERYIYQVNYLPAPFWNRDIIMHSLAKANKRGDVVTIKLRAVPSFCDKQKMAICRNLAQHRAGKKIVRVEKARGFFKIRKLSSEMVEVTWQMHAEPGGDVSGWMANLNLLEIPFETLKGLKSYVKANGNRKNKLTFVLSHLQGIGLSQ